MKSIPILFVAFAVACGGLQTTESDCEEGFTKADDGACYPSAIEGEGGGGGDNNGGGASGGGGEWNSSCGLQLRLG